VVTGVLAAFREIDDIFFLRWSGYGNVVLIKAGLVLLAAAAAGIATVRARRSGTAHSERALGIEAGVLALVVVLAAVLSGLVPGRGQALPAERGNLLPGPAIASALAEGGPMRVTLAPARAGDNVLTAVQEPAPGKQVVPNTKAVSAELTCQCSDQSIDAKFVRGPGDVWSTDVSLPADGTWFARLNVDGKDATAMALNVGVPEARGPDPLEVLSVADLSGRGAASCRSHLLGVELAVGRMNALGGFDDGRKVALTALDDGGSAERAAELAKSAIDSGDVLALVGACGEGAEGAVKAASAAGVPSIVADPTVPIVNADNVFRSAGDPYAEGFSDAQYIESTVATAQTSNVVRAVDTGTAENARLLAGLRAGLAKSKYQVTTLKPGDIDADPPQLSATLDQANAAAVVVDGDPQVIAERFRALGPERLDFATAPIIASAASYSEDMVRRSGAIGRIGALQGPAEIAPDTTVGATYARAVPALFPGELPSLEGLRGYTAGLALSYALEDGTDPEQIVERLVRPSQFADSLLAPWRSDGRSLGSQRFEFLKPSFLPPTLIPTSAGGEAQAGTFFTDGTWARTNTELLGPPLDQPVPPLDDSG
jgi:ABC-type branched-subunit amino acid transport system substrate-binding protein